jgi:integrase
MRKKYLTLQELDSLICTDLSSSNLKQVRDIFIFSCFTSLPYADVSCLQKKNIENERWIKGEHKLNGIGYKIPLLPISKMIYKKYVFKTRNSNLFPAYSNQRINLYLREIADICGIEKPLTFHSARNTFAFLTLSYGVSSETVSKIMGCQRANIVRLFPFANDEKLINDMALFAGKMKDTEMKFLNVN